MPNELVDDALSKTNELVIKKFVNRPFLTLLLVFKPAKYLLHCQRNFFLKRRALA